VAGAAVVGGGAAGVLGGACAIGAPDAAAALAVSRPASPLIAA
jgi:hypothetical protein